MLRQHCTDEEVQQYKEEFAALAPSDVDVGMHDLLVSLNQLPGVSTRFSCKSHGETNPDNRRFYILFACSAEGVAKVQSLFNCLVNEFTDPELNKRGILNSQIKASIRWHELSLSYCYLASPTAYFAKDNSVDFNCRYIPGWTLCATLFNDRQVMYFIGLLRGVVKTLLKEEQLCQTHTV